MNDVQAARGLGLASFGIGLAEITAPRQLERLMGIGDGRNTGVMRALGLREMMQGVDIVTHRNPTPGIWALAGDVLDGVVLGLAATRTRRPRGFAAVCAMVLPIVALDVLLAMRLAKKRRSLSGRLRQRLVHR